MSKFKRVSLLGSEELFRPTRPEIVKETDELIAEVLDHEPVEVIEVVQPTFAPPSFTPREIDLLVESVQMAKYPEKARPKPSLDKFGRLDALKAKLQDLQDAAT